MRHFHTIDLLQPQIEKILRDSRPDCIISDMFFHMTVDIALELGIPRLAFSSSGFFHHSISYAVEHYEPHKNKHFEREPFVIPSLPDQVLISKLQLPHMGQTKTTFPELLGKVKEAEKKSYGMVVNSFHALESAYADYYRKAIGIKARFSTFVLVT
ncbi:hypothetical protein Acr_04g0007880 [Actinidia rufa]|uniref:Uncharacterized protein n=1 Tax=Actinidia rufa TaxID=165716 RepID=A0A7J0EI44_9ERIC|nr:hypothetical protein Acr_04g0007880 [Actinidia rufa]